MVVFRRGKMGGLGRVNRICGSIESRVKTGHFLMGQSGCGSSWVGLS